MGQGTAKQYADKLDENLRELHERLRDNRYVVPPVERVWIEKEDGKTRPRGEPCVEDKMVQRAVGMILAAIFAPDLHAFSHGFRKGPSQHQALHELREQCRKLHITWVVEADVRGWFDTLDWSHLRACMQQRGKEGGLAADRQMAPHRGAGGGSAQLPGQRYAARRGHYTSYKVANILVEFSTSIPRTQLRPSYGDGFPGAPLQTGQPPERRTSQQRGGRRGTSSAHSDPGDSSHV